MNRFPFATAGATCASYTFRLWESTEKYLSWAMLAVCAFSDLANAQTPSISAKVIGQNAAANSVTAVLEFSNSGSVAADNVYLTNVTARVLTGSGVVTISSPGLPTLMENLAVGASDPITFVLSVPPSVTRFALVESGSVQDAEGNTYQFSSSQFVNNANSAVNVSSGVLTFPTQNTGTASAGQAVTISNTGNQPVTVSSIALSGTNAGDYAISSNSCGTSIGVGGTCYVYVTFTPIASGTRTAAVTITDSATGSPQTISLSGTGQSLTSGLNITPNSLTYPEQNLNSPSASQTVTVSNLGTTAINFTSIALTGSNASDFTVSSNSCGSSLVAGNQCFVNIIFTPSAPGSRSAALTLINSASDSPQSVVLTGTGQRTTTLTFNPATLSFTSTNIGVAVNQNLIVTNSGTVSAFFSSFLTGGTNASDFAITANSCPTGSTPLGAGSSCTVRIAMNPSASGQRSANLTVMDNAATSPQVIFLSGKGALPSQTLAFQYLVIPFNGQSVGSTSASQSTSVTNTGNTTVNLSSITVTGTNASDFAISANQCASSNGNALMPNQSCSLYVTFTPTAAGIRNASLTYTDSAAGSPQSILLTGNGTTPAAGATLQQEQLDYAAQDIGTTSAQRQTYIYNSGTTPLVISSITIGGPHAGDFSISQNECASRYSDTVPVGGNCYVYVTFTPTTTGARRADLTFTDNGPSSPQSMLLNGVGQASTQTVSTSVPEISFGGQYLGTPSAAQSVYLQNTGTLAVDISSITITGANGGDYTLTQNQCATGYTNVLPAGAQCYVSVAFSPLAAGARTAALSFASNATGSPLKLPLNGLGLTGGMVLNVLPANLNFSGPVGVTSAPQIVTVFNSGAQPLSLFSLSITGPSDYVLGASSCPLAPSTLAPGSSCTLSVTYTPSAVGTSSASLGMTSSAGTQAVGLNGSGQNPTMTLSVPTSIAFNTQSVSVTSIAQAVTIQNTGNDAISLTGFAISGSDASDFGIGANSCSSSLAAGANCTVGVIFTPSAAGSRSATLVITDGATGSPQSVSLSGTGSSSLGGFVISAQALDFGVRSIGSKSDESGVNLVNTGGSNVIISYAITGTNAGDFVISSNGCTAQYANVLPPNNTSCKVYVTFTPQGGGPRSAILQLTDNASGSPQTVILSGIGETVPILTFSATSLSFPTTNVAGSNPPTLLVTLTAGGSGPVTMSAYDITGTNANDFSISLNSCPKGNANVLVSPNPCYIYVTFAPSGTGIRTATLQIADNAPGSPQSILLQGAGQSVTPSVSLAPVTTDFGVHNIGLSTPGPALSVTNTGTVGVAFSNYVITGANAADFSLATNQCASSYSGVLPIGYSCSFSVTFTPSAAGVRTAALTLTDNATGSPQSFLLTGSGQPISKSLAYSFTHDFGVENVDTTSQAGTLSFTNTGTSAITLSNYAVSGTNASDFAITSNQCASTYSNVLTPSNYCYLQVSFTPSATGTRTATLTLTDDAAGGPQSVLLTGVGQALTRSLQISPQTVLYTSIVGLTAGVKYAYFTNTGNGAITFSNATVTGNNASDFSITNNYCISGLFNNGLNPANRCYFGLTFTPSTAGTETATLNVTDSSSATAQTVNLVGLGQSVNKVLKVSDEYLLFGALAIGSNSQAYFYLTPISTGPVTPSNFAITGANASDFSMTASSTCHAGTAITSNCSISIQFAPSTAGLRTANLQITDDAAGTTQNVALAGTGYVTGTTQISYSMAYIDFGRIPVNTAASQQHISLQNSSGSAVFLGSPTLVGTDASDFSLVSSTCGASIAAHATCDAYFSFTPASVGPRLAALQFPDSGGTSTVLTLLLVGDGNGGSSYVGIYPAGLEFDATNVNATAAYQNVVLINAGAGTVNLSSFTFTGSNAADFSLYSNTCSSALEPDGSCTVYVQFTPGAAGLRTATLQIADDALNTAQSVALAGVGQAGSEALYTSTPNLDFGSQNANGGSYKETVSLFSGGTANIALSSMQITGSNASDFTFFSNNCGANLKAAGTCSVTLQFAPSGTGMRTANLVVTSDAPGSPFLIPLTGFGQPQTMVISLDHVSLDLGVENVSAQTTSQIIVTNQGDAPVGFTPPAITGTNAGDFVIAANACGSSLAAGTSCNITVAFTPSATGPRTATLQINANASGSPQTVALSGTGQVVSHLLSASVTTLNFGVLNVGNASSASYVTIANTGTDTVNISNIGISGADAGDFQMTSTSNCTTALASGSACHVYVQFVPSSSGPGSATLTVSSNAANNPLLVALVGEGQAATYSLLANTPAIDFGRFQIGASAPDFRNSVLLTNNGTGTVQLYAPSFTGANAANFGIFLGCTGSLAPGNSCTVNLSFTPSAAGLLTATLNINSTATGGPIAVLLTGTGLAISGAVLNFQNPVIFDSTPVVLLCYKRLTQQKGQQGSCQSRILAMRIRSVAMERGLCRSARTRRAAGLEPG